MRVLFIHNRYRSGQPSGEDRVVEQEIQLLSRAGHTVRIYEQSSDDIATFSHLEKIGLAGRVTWSVRDRAAIRESLRDFRPDVVHVHNTFPLISPSFLGACRQLGVPVVMTVHNARLACAAGSLFRDGTECFECLRGSVFPAIRHRCYADSLGASLALASSIALHRRRRTWQDGVSTFIVMSSYYRDLLVAENVLPLGQTFLKPHFVNRPKTVRDGAGGPFLFIGRLDRAKGVDLLLEAWDQSLGRLLIVGSGPDEQRLRGAAAQHAGSVRFAGLLPHEEAMELLGRARALVVPSRSLESFGLTVVEAYARGVPVIAPRRGVFLETVKHEGTGWHFQSGSAESLKDAMTALTEDRTVVRLGAQCLLEYEERYSPEHNITLLEEVYAAAVASTTGN